MAFTELEVREAEDAINTVASAEDMFRLGRIEARDERSRFDIGAARCAWLDDGKPRIIGGLVTLRVYSLLHLYERIGMRIIYARSYGYIIAAKLDVLRIQELRSTTKVK